MPKLRDRELVAFQCTNCSRDVAWTAPGEAKRITVRAAVYCEQCKDAPAPLTERQAEAIEVAAKLRERTGRAPTLGDIGEAMSPPLSRSRVQSIAASIRLRGHAEAFDVALHGPMPGPLAAPKPVEEKHAMRTPAISDELPEELSPLDALEAAAATSPSWDSVRY